jgi:hypothetical protein
MGKMGLGRKNSKVSGGGGAKGSGAMNDKKIKFESNESYLSKNFISLVCNQSTTSS